MTLVVSLLEVLVELIVSLLELVVSPPPFFASSKIFSFIFFIKFSLSLRPASTRSGSLSFVTFCHVLSMIILGYKEKGLKQRWIQFLNIWFLIQPGNS